MAIITGGPGAVTLGPADRAAAVAAVKAELRAGLAEDDALIGALADSAIGLAEQVTGQVLIAREVAADMPAGAAWEMLPAVPVRAIQAAPDMTIDIDGDGRGWVRMAAAARVTFTAGIAPDWDGLPAGLRQGVAMLAAHLFADRGATTPVPAAVTALWRPFRRVALIPGVRA
jgi:hypothetical protein